VRPLMDLFGPAAKLGKSSKLVDPEKTYNILLYQ
jgi:hypothetical protein